MAKIETIDCEYQGEEEATVYALGQKDVLRKGDVIALPLAEILPVVRGNRLDKKWKVVGQLPDEEGDKKPSASQPAQTNPASPSNPATKTSAVTPQPSNPAPAPASSTPPAPTTTVEPDKHNET